MSTSRDWEITRSWREISRKFSTGLDRVEIFKRNSMDLRANDILTACGPDGCFRSTGVIPQPAP